MAKKTNQTKVTINDTYYVLIDNYNYVLMKKTQSKKSEKTYEITVGYYPNMQYVLKAIRREEMTNLTTDLTLDKYLDKLSELEQTIR